VRGRKLAVLSVLAAAAVVGCIQIRIPGEETLFVTGTPFVLSGTASVENQVGPCLIWTGENGITYHLFQGVDLPSADFDRVTTPGTTSRLELSTRADLEVSCEGGTIVEVERVLEIVE
jgi:hypothetical protein